jgi:hypothetical protein
MTKHAALLSAAARLARLPAALALLLLCAVLSAQTVVVTDLSQVTEMLPGLTKHPVPPKAPPVYNATFAFDLVAANPCAKNLYPLQGKTSYWCSSEPPVYNHPGTKATVTLPMAVIKLPGNKVGCMAGLKPFAVPGDLAGHPEFVAMAGAPIGNPPSANGTSRLIVCSR